MSNNKITVNFTLCEDAPAEGYNILYRPIGSDEPYRDAGNFEDSPAIFYDTTDGDNQQYEGVIRSNTAEGVYCNDIPFTTVAPGLIELRFYTSLSGSEFVQTGALLTAPIDVDIEILAQFSDGYTAAMCAGLASAATQIHNRTIVAGGTGQSGNESPTGTWTTATSYKVYNISIEVDGGADYSGPIINGQIITMGSYTVKCVFMGC